MTAPSSPRVLVIEHEVDDPAHLFGEWLVAAGAVLDPVRPYEGDRLPATLEGYDALLVMGGAMGANDDETVAWLAPVKDLVRAAVRDDVPLLGICLGHQLAAAALGGRVARNPRGKQFGLLPVGWTAAAASDELVEVVATEVRALQWNDDVVVEPPAGAVLLARAATGEVQALRFAPMAWGVQWHPEVDASLVARWLVEDADGIDLDVARREVTALVGAADELAATWQPLATRFAQLAATTR